MKKIGFIGCGNMGGALALAVSKTTAKENIFLSDKDTSKRDALASIIGANTLDSACDIVRECDIIFLGVKPQVFPALFDEIGATLGERAKSPLLITMAAGLSIAALGDMAKSKECRIIRIMPNTPVSVGQGMILYSLGKGATEDDKADFLEILRAAGKLDLIDEKLIDAASALSGCSPAFVYMFAEALADGALECGLPRDKADLYAAQTLLGAAQMLLETGKHPGALKDAVCSPGGTTIAGVHALEDGAFRSTVMSAVKSAYDRTLELKK